MSRKFVRRDIEWADPDAKKEYNRQYYQEHHAGTIKRAKPVTVNGISYDSIAEAARAHGITKQRMSQIVQKRGRAVELADPREGYDIDF